MKGDFTRSTFRPKNHYSSVRLQQGRVQLDAEWNEQVDIQTYLGLTTNGDIIGCCGAPLVEDSLAVNLNSISLLGLYFINTLKGWAVGENGTVLMTFDGGRSWGRQAIPAGTSQNLNGVHFVDEFNGWVVGNSATILFTTDGGNSWVQQSPPSGVTQNLRGVYFVNLLNGWAVGNTAKILFTSDGGSTWIEQDTPSGLTQNLLGVQFADQQNGWIVGTSATILATADGGNTWEQQTLPGTVSQNLRNLHFIDDQKGWVVGNNAAILSSTDGGSNWTEQSPPTGVANTLRDVHFIDDQTGWAVGNNSTILTTADGGSNWSKQVPSSAMTPHLWAIHFIDDRDGYAVGNSGAILHTEDGGTTWQGDNLSANLMISAGHIYVDGILCESDDETAYLDQPDLLRLPRLDVTGSSKYLAYIDVWRRHLTAIDRPELREVALGGPDTATRTQTVWQVKLEAIGAGDTCNFFDCDWLPAGTEGTGRLRAWADPSKDPDDGQCLVPPGGGYRGLENQLYRVEIQQNLPPYAWPRPGSVISSDVSGITDSNQITVADWYLEGRAWQIGQMVELYSDETDVAAAAGTLARVTAVDAENFIVTIDADVSAMTGHTNLKLRHVSSYMWSRDNGSMVARLTEMDDVNSTLTISRPGPDGVQGFIGAMWVEVIDEARVLAGDPGVLMEVNAVQDNRVTIKNWPEGIGRSSLGEHVIVRRWDGTGAVVVGDNQELEDGVYIEFDIGVYRTGDYWMIPARSLTGEVEWPRDETGALFEVRHGIHHHYCSLGILEYDSGSQTWSVIDCRHRFPTLTEISPLSYVSGDGQEAMPDFTDLTKLVPLPMPLQVGVANRVGAMVRFRITEGSGSLNGSGPSVDIPTDDVNGNVYIASCNWELDSTTHSQQVEAYLLDDGGQPVPLSIRFNANLSQASHVGYKPDACDYMTSNHVIEEPAKTVQEAIDHLCPRIRMTMEAGDGQQACVGKPLPQDLKVAVFWGKVPLSEHKVTFAVVEGDATPDPMNADIDEDGIARCKVTVNSIDGGSVIRIEATLNDPPGAPAPPTIEFAARLVEADCVYVAKDICPGLDLEENKRTVSALLQHLCQHQGQEPGVRVRAIVRGNDENEIVPLLVDDIIPSNDLAKGLAICCDAAIDPASVDDRAVGTVSLELPSLYLGSLGANPLAGYDPVVIAGRFTVTELDKKFPNHCILWKPNEYAIKILENANIIKVLHEHKIPVDKLLVRLKLNGNFIWAEESKDELLLFLDGNLYGTRKFEQNSGFHPDYPSGDGRRGGSLEMRFYIAESEKVPGRFGFIPLKEGKFFTKFDTFQLSKLGRVFASGVNRKAITDSKTTPANFRYDQTLPFEPELAMNLLKEIDAINQLPTNKLKIVVRKSNEQRSFQKVLKVVGESLKASTELELQPLAVAGNFTKAVLRLLDQNTEFDAVFGPVDELKALRSDEHLGHRFGPLLIVF